MSDNFIFVVNTRRNGTISYKYEINSKEDSDRAVKLGAALKGRCDYKVFYTCESADKISPDVKVVNSLDELMYYVALEQRTSSLDVAEYIMSICSCTYRELQHLVIKSQLYYAYCYHGDLCDDRLIDLPSGPAYEDLFSELHKANGFLELEGACDQFRYIRDGKKKMCAINDVLSMELLEGVKNGNIKLYEKREL